MVCVLDRTQKLKPRQGKWNKGIFDKFKGEGNSEEAAALVGGGAGGTRHLRVAVSVKLLELTARG